MAAVYRRRGFERHGAMAACQPGVAAAQALSLQRPHALAPSRAHRPQAGIVPLGQRPCQTVCPHPAGRVLCRVWPDPHPAPRPNLSPALRVPDRSSARARRAYAGRRVGQLRRPRMATHALRSSSPGPAVRLRGCEIQHATETVTHARSKQ